MTILFHLLSGLGSLVFGNLAPKVFEYFTRRQDNAHELAVLTLQIDAAKQNAGAKLDAVVAQGSSNAFVAAINAQARPSGVKWVDAYSSLIRPATTTLILAAFLVHKLSTWPDVKWDDFDMYLTEMVIGYWYGDRAHVKSKR